MSIQAYQRAATQAESPREIEYRAFGTVTAGLVRAKEHGRSELTALAEALDANNRLWSLFSADCGTAGNQLPAALRAQIISLALWVSRHTSQILREGADIDPLIEINRTMMEGLKPA